MAHNFKIQVQTDVRYQQIPSLLGEIPTAGSRNSLSIECAAEQERVFSFLFFVLPVPLNCIGLIQDRDTTIMESGHFSQSVTHKISYRKMACNLLSGF